MIMAISEKFDEELSQKQNEIEEAMQNAENNSDIEEKIALYQKSVEKTDSLLSTLL